MKYYIVVWKNIQKYNMYFKVNASSVSALCRRHRHTTYESAIEPLIPSDVLVRMKKAYVDNMSSSSSDEEDIMPPLPQTRTERLAQHKKMVHQSSSSLANLNAFVEKKSISTQDIAQVAQACTMSTMAGPLDGLSSPTQKEMAEAVRSVAFCKRGTHLESETINILHKFWSGHEGIDVLSKPGGILRRVMYFSAAEDQVEHNAWNSIEEMQTCGISPPYYSITGRADALMKDHETGDMRGIIEIKNRMYKFSTIGSAPLYDMDQLCIYMMLFQNIPYGYLAEQYDGDVVPSVEMMTLEDARDRWSSVLKPALDSAIRDVQHMCDDPTSSRSRRFISCAL